MFQKQDLDAFANCSYTTPSPTLELGSQPETHLGISHVSCITTEAANERETIEMRDGAISQTVLVS